MSGDCHVATSVSDDGGSSGGFQQQSVESGVSDDLWVGVIGGREVAVGVSCCRRVSA